MSHEHVFPVELSRDEFHSLQECLSFVRKEIAEHYQQDGSGPSRESINDPLFVAASKLAYKLAKVERPDSEVALRDFLNYGSKVPASGDLDA